MSPHGINICGGKPRNLLIRTKPCHLPFRIVTRVTFYYPEGIFKSV
jgi:hypothetical protein